MRTLAELTLACFNQIIASLLIISMSIIGCICFMLKLEKQGNQFWNVLGSSINGK